MKIVKLVFFLIILGVVVFINIRIYAGPDFNVRKELKNSCIEQLNFLEGKLKNERLADKMQFVFPEGFVFANVLYGLSWCELSLGSENDTSLQMRALEEARYAFEQINTDKARQIFSKNLNLRYGIFYRGWRNYLLGKILSCQRNKDSTELSFFIEECESIADAYEHSETPYLESYPNARWPADAFLGIASLKIHDNLLEEKYDTLVNNWLNLVKLKLDPATGLIPHSIHPSTGEILEGARGSSISLILRILSEIEPEFGIEQFQLYEKHFSMSILGFPAIREYPKGKSGKGDIDSGPVILGIGFAGTIVGIGTLKCYNEVKSANLLSNTIETFGIPISSNNKKKYIFGKLPIADLFICWSRASNINSEVYSLKTGDAKRFGSKLSVHLYSLLIALILLLLFYGRLLLKKKV